MSSPIPINSRNNWFEDQVSLLWPEGQPPETDNWLEQSAVRDLDVERIARAVAPLEERRATSREILQNLIVDPAIICYRQDVVADLLAHPLLLDAFDAILPALSNLGRFRHRRLGADHSLYEVTWRAGELEILVECVQRLHAAFEQVEDNLQSEGLRELTQAVRRAANDERFEQLVAELPALLSELRASASVTIGVNLGPQLQPVEAVLISVNNERYSDSPLLSRMLGRTDEYTGVAPLHSMPRKEVQGHYAFPLDPEVHGYAVEPMMVPLFRDLAEVLKKSCQPIAEALKQYVGFNGRFLAALEPELAFYVGAVRMLHALREAGLPVCRPELAPMEEGVCVVEESYNLNLALHCLVDNPHQALSEQIVTNRIALDAGGKIAVLTGPNRGGKTTYLQAVGLVQIMAQVGLFVPGTSARISPVENIYTHYPLEERLERGMGRFGDEAQRLGDIFTRIDHSSLLLLNEPLTGTTPGESIYLAVDVLRVLQRLGARCVLVTHLHELVERTAAHSDDTEKKHPITSLVASPPEGTDPAGETLSRTYKIVPALPIGRSYAREIARRYGIMYEQIVESLQERGVL